MKKVLLVEDSDIVLELQKSILEGKYLIKESKTAKDALFKIKEWNPDLVVLDIGLEGKEDGFYVLEEINKNRRIYAYPTIIIMSADVEIEDVLKGYEMGIKDYIRKPCVPKEFEYKVKIAAEMESNIKKAYKYKELLYIDTDNQEIYFENKMLEVEKRIYEILEYFVMNKGIVLTRKKIYEYLCNEEFLEGNRTVDIYVTRLKKQIPFLKNYLKSIRNFGYKLEKD